MTNRLTDAWIINSNRLHLMHSMLPKTFKSTNETTNTQTGISNNIKTIKLIRLLFLFINSKLMKRGSQFITSTGNKQNKWLGLHNFGCEDNFYCNKNNSSFICKCTL